MYHRWLTSCSCFAFFIGGLGLTDVANSQNCHIIPVDTESATPGQYLTWPWPPKTPNRLHSCSLLSSSVGWRIVDEKIVLTLIVILLSLELLTSLSFFHGCHQPTTDDRMDLTSNHVKSKEPVKRSREKKATTMVVKSIFQKNYLAAHLSLQLQQSTQFRPNNHTITTSTVQSQPCIAFYDTPL